MNWYLKVLQNYVTFSGRARRKEYWMFTLVNVIISIVLAIIDGLIFDNPVGILRGLYSLAVLLPSLAVAVRRMHDVGKSGWFILIPIYNLILACTEGEHGENAYGPDPKNESSMNDTALDSHLTK
jgi:uncharacterized membrane protein YhaH (DUF805 family)